MSSHHNRKLLESRNTSLRVEEIAARAQPEERRLSPAKPMQGDFRPSISAQPEERRLSPAKPMQGDFRPSISAQPEAQRLSPAKPMQGDFRLRRPLQHLTSTHQRLHRNEMHFLINYGKSLLITASCMSLCVPHHSMPNKRMQ
ncbi:uncharacterized protein LOC144336302 [Macaca mulatta]